MDEITYAKVGGPPDFWLDLRVIDLDTGAEITTALEVNTKEGWLVRYVDGSPSPDLRTERVTGRFRLERTG